MFFFFRIYDKWQSPLLSTTFELITSHQNLQDANEKLKEKKKEKKLRDLDMKKKAVELEKKRENFKNSERELKEIFAVSFFFVFINHAGDN